MQVGFIGLGRMGSPIAANLLGAGHDLTVYNRTKAKAEHLVPRGAQLAKSRAMLHEATLSSPCLPTTMLSNRRYLQRTESSPR